MFGVLWCWWFELSLLRLRFIRCLLLLIDLDLFIRVCVCCLFCVVVVCVGCMLILMRCGLLFVCDFLCCCRCVCVRFLVVFNVCVAFIWFVVALVFVVANVCAYSLFFAISTCCFIVRLCVYKLCCHCVCVVCLDHDLCVSFVFVVGVAGVTFCCLNIVLSGKT